MNVEIIKPYGYCNGVLNSIKIAKKAINKYPNNNIFLLGPLVHNEITNKELIDMGANIIDIPSDQYSFYLEHLTKNDLLVLRAHGTSEYIYELLKRKEINYFDATCPIVNKINGFIKNIDDKQEIIYIGINNHPESIVSLSYAKTKVHLYDVDSKQFDYSKVKTEEPIVINQSTIADISLQPIYVDIKKHFPKAIIQEFICPAVNERQQNLIRQINRKDLFIIIGSKTSNNTRTLLEIAYEYTLHTNCLQVNSLEETKKVDFHNYKKVYLISGTSTPNSLVEDIYSYIQSL